MSFYGYVNWESKMALGKFITFEGGEGSGKSTQLKLLQQALESANIDNVFTREPGGTKGAEEIRNLLVTGDVNRWDAVTETLLHFAARRDHVVKLIQPAIESGTWVVCDRFIHSTLAYQGYGHELGEEYIKILHNLIIGRIYPCLTFILDINPEDGIKRAMSRSDNENRYEKMDINYHHTLRNGFLDIAKQDKVRCVVIDATKKIDEVHSQVIDIINERFNKKLTTTKLL